MSVDGDCCLAGFRATAVLRDGTAVCVRAIRPDDKERLRVAFARLSTRSVYQRFFHPVTDLVADALRRLTEIDFRDHVGIVLTRRADRRTLHRRRRRSRGLRRGRGRGRVTVADDFPHRGAATLLLRELVAIGRKRGTPGVVALVPTQPTDAQVFGVRSAVTGIVRHGVDHVALNLDLPEPAIVRRRRWSPSATQ